MKGGKITSGRELAKPLPENKTSDLRQYPGKKAPKEGCLNEMDKNRDGVEAEWVTPYDLWIATKLFPGSADRRQRFISRGARGVASIQKILLKNPLSRKILDFWGIKSPCLYRKNAPTGILERLFFAAGIRFFNVGKEGGSSAESFV
jgi:hypothetical protein